jgi:DNA-3-methyladenine glycosylase
MAYLKREFFARDTFTVARDLLGTVLVVDGVEGRIVEVEAYTTDAASHFAMRPNKSSVMRETYGHVYVYFIYGMYYCLNFSTDREGPGAVLIRAVEPLSGIEKMMARRGTDDIKKLASGPGRLCQAFAVDLAFTGKPIGKEIKVKERTGPAPNVELSKRIGITRAAELEWRFYEADSPFVSKAPRDHPPDRKTRAR